MAIASNPSTLIQYNKTNEKKIDMVGQQKKKLDYGEMDLKGVHDLGIVLKDLIIVSLSIAHYMHQPSTCTKLTDREI